MDNKNENEKGFVTELAKIPVAERLMNYGTAGFRCHGSLLDSVAFRMGCLCVLRSLSLGEKEAGGKGVSVGLMITASHNPEKDNGLKIVDGDGGMLVREWEGVAAVFANAQVSEFVEELMKVKEKRVREQTEATIIFGRDSRSSSPRLCALGKKGAHLCANLLGVKVLVIDLGLVTTPQLHWAVGYVNGGGEETESEDLLKAYYKTLSESFQKAITLSASLKAGEKSPPNDGALLVDCAFGVGSVAAHQLFPLCPSESHLFKYEIRNEEGKGTLNFEVGADFVKSKQKFPLNFNKISPGTKVVSIDGDADRLIYFYKHQDGEIRILDGDKILCLFTHFVSVLLDSANLKEKATIGVIQTGYANGASSDYITKQKIPLIFTATGVKHLHKAALNYDVGIYFEANGHGTVYFSQKIQNTIKNELKKERERTKDEEISLQILNLLPNLVNQTVGDSLSDILFVETALFYLGWTINDWDSLYTNKPFSLSALRIPDRTIFRTSPETETLLISPQGFQKDLEKVLRGGEGGGKWRGFVRPSGTEDVVRVYVEGEGGGRGVEEVVKEVEGLVRSYCGMGEK